MISRNKNRKPKTEAGSLKSEVRDQTIARYQLAIGNWQLIKKKLLPRFRSSGNTQTHTHKLPVAYCILPVTLFFTGCYSFRDVAPIPQDVKTIHVGYIENRARYINPQLSPQMTDKLRQKINNQTRLTLVQGEDADYNIKATITGYNVTTAAISQQQAATNRLTVTVKLEFKATNHPDKNQDTDVSRNFDFSANLTIDQAQAQLTETIIKNMVDEIFNRIFSDW